ncbi:hypothetical protein EYF80_001168 [Liparis tanakae]|uniref:Uncharacterized protein n=1 Tax=Liparis tanakae TaxID=230148 RepID=A0A4Z2JDR5_9TELE|nr:hypothetical protein EYF80_001168 [Liparis tanakae]
MVPKEHRRSPDRDTHAERKRYRPPVVPFSSQRGGESRGRSRGTMALQFQRKLPVEAPRRPPPHSLRAGLGGLMITMARRNRRPCSTAALISRFVNVTVETTCGPPTKSRVRNVLDEHRGATADMFPEACSAVARHSSPDSSIRSRVELTWSRAERAEPWPLSSGEACQDSQVFPVKTLVPVQVRPPEARGDESSTCRYVWQ